MYDLGITKKDVEEVAKEIADKKYQDKLLTVATAAMQGLLPNRNHSITDIGQDIIDLYASLSVRIAKAIIAECEKEAKNEP